MDSRSGAVWAWWLAFDMPRKRISPCSQSSPSTDDFLNCSKRPLQNVPLQPNESIEDYSRRMTQEAHGAWQRAHPEYGKTVMPHVNQMLSSKYLGKQDLPHPVVAHIRGVAMEPAGRNNEDPKWLMYFHELRKPMKLNNTILNYMAQNLGPNSDGWVGVKCQVYIDPSVQFGGQYVGGVRLKVAKSARRPMADVSKEFNEGAGGQQPQGSGGPVFAGVQPNRPTAGAGAPPAAAPPADPYHEYARSQTQAPPPPMRANPPPPANSQPDEYGEWKPPADAEFDDDIPF